LVNYLVFFMPNYYFKGAIMGAIGDLGNANFSLLALKAFYPTHSTDQKRDNQRQRYWITSCVVYGEKTL